MKHRKESTVLAVLLLIGLGLAPYSLAADTPGNAKTSLLVQILQGPAQGFEQMPADGPPFFTPAQLQPIIDWVNAGCPN